ncbi:transcriptional regulator GcvA [Moritella sp. 5]|uniref:transcriptional regulator GcvA n=1 Tax=Moritella sp. 5 TaxID=2746231 RepID=UPI001BA99C2A|nr:transcriptional regulator GcvA [Moritella sp. 5]QUM81852.1 transcriptional regulator GcvA [Moritella sp. 5]
MKKNLPPLNWLRSFEASARHLNFTQAANELNLTQAAISTQIKCLEANLGMPLFTRLPRGLTLTDSGQSYLPPVSEAINKLAATTNEIFGDSKKIKITVCSNLVFFCQWLAPRMASFYEQHPDILIRFTSNIWADDLDKNSDVNVGYGHGNWDGFRSDRLTWDELIPVCSPTLLSCMPTPKCPSELNEYALLHVIGYEEGWGHWLNATGFHDINTDKGMTFDTLVSAFEMAKHGHGIALGRSSLVKKSILKGELIAPFSQTIPTTEGFYLKTPTSQIDNKKIETFRQWILSEIY